MAEIDTREFIPLLRYIAPGSELQAIDVLNLGFSNRSVRLRVTQPDQSQTNYVAKQYSTSDNVFGQDTEARAQFEYKTLTLLRNGGVPCPEPVFFDAKGDTLGAPLLVTKEIPGAQILAHPANELWAERAPIVATLLAQIHIFSCPDEFIAMLPDAKSQATWFMKKDTIPDYMQAYPDGESIWNILIQELPQLQPVPSCLVHGDYWSGNILWDKGQLTGILDWENAAFGDPGFDLAYCRMEMIIDGMWEAADTFLKVYESQTGRPIRHLGLRELAVAVQPMWQHAPYLNISPMKERFRQFVANAIRNL